MSGVFLHQTAFCFAALPELTSTYMNFCLSHFVLTPFFSFSGLIHSCKVFKMLVGFIYWLRPAWKSIQLLKLRSLPLPFLTVTFYFPKNVQFPPFFSLSALPLISLMLYHLMAYWDPMQMFLKSIFYKKNNNNNKVKPRLWFTFSLYLFTKIWTTQPNIS